MPWHFHDQFARPRYGQVSAGQDGNWILSFSCKSGEPLSALELANAKHLVHCVDTHDYLLMAMNATIANYKEPNLWVGPVCAAIEKAAAPPPDGMAPTATPWVYFEQGDANEYCLLTPDKNGWVLGFRQNGSLSMERQRENCRLMVKAVNAHEDLLGTLRLAVRHKYVTGLWLGKADALMSNMEGYALTAQRPAPLVSRERG
jgi:hypothetical protein